MARKGDYVREFISILLTIVSIVAAPLMVLLLPLYLFRVVVQLLAKLFRPDLGKMLSPRGNLFAVELNEMFTKRTRCAIYVSHVIDTNIDLESFRKYFNENVVQRRLWNTGKLQSPELQQTITSWLGYLFWKWDKEFKIENHVKPGPCNGKVSVSDEDIPEIMAEVSASPFEPGRSPWEMLVWNNARLKRDPEGRPKTILVLRVHHSMADGFAITRLLVEDVAKAPMTTPGIHARRPDEGRLSKVLKLCGLLIKAPYEMISLSIHSWDFNEWHKPERALKGKLHMAVSEVVPVEYIKEIKRQYETSFHAVIQAAFAGAIRKHMIEQRMKVPHTLHCMIPLPMTGHPTKLRNHMTAVLAPLPVEVQEARDRLYAAEKSLQNLRHSSVPLATFCMLPIVGSLPAWVVKILATNLIATCILSIFPAPGDTVYCMGRPVEDIMFGGGLLVGNMGLGFSSLSYDGLIRFGVGIDEGIYASPEHVKSLVRRVVEELRILHGDNAV